MWTDKQLELLIKERKENNAHYHDLIGNGKMNFWRGVSAKINDEFGTAYSSKQCKEKFQSLVRCYRVSEFILISRIFKTSKHQI